MSRFTLDLAKAVKNINGEAEKIVRGTIFSVASNIIKGTPVGDPTYWKSSPPPGYTGGSLRGAWQASVNAPKYDKTRPKDKTGAQTIADMTPVALNLIIGQDFYLTNPLPYAYRVEFGWSKQRPNGMLRVAIMQANAALERLAR
jgi:hypothetical protein